MSPAFFLLFAALYPILVDDSVARGLTRVFVGLLALGAALAVPWTGILGSSLPPAADGGVCRFRSRECEAGGRCGRGLA